MRIKVKKDGLINSTFSWIYTSSVRKIGKT